MPKFERPSAEAIALIRDELRRNPEKNALALWLALANETDVLHDISREDQGFVLGYALAVLDAEKSAQSTTLVSAPPSSVAEPLPTLVQAQVADHVEKWLRRMADEYWSDSECVPRTLRMQVLKYTGRNDEPALHIEVEERPITEFSGPAK